MRKVSMNARLSHDAVGSDEVHIVLVKISHPDLPEPIRLSTDPTERISVEPLMYGTRSRWQTTGGEPFLFVLMSALLPDDQEDTPPAATVVLEATSTELTEAVRSTTGRATVDMAVVLASSPHLIEQEYIGLKLMAADWDASQVALQISRDPLFGEPWPAGRMTRQRFPGMHK